jgi:hypothetical protein
VEKNSREGLNEGICFSLTVAAMGAATAFLWINRSQVAD